MQSVFLSSQSTRKVKIDVFTTKSSIHKQYIVYIISLSVNYIFNEIPAWTTTLNFQNTNWDLGSGLTHSTLEHEGEGMAVWLTAKYKKTPSTHPPQSPNGATWAVAWRSHAAVSPAQWSLQFWMGNDEEEWPSQDEIFVGWLLNIAATC